MGFKWGGGVTMMVLKRTAHRTTRVRGRNPFVQCTPFRKVGRGAVASGVCMQQQLGIARPLILDCHTIRLSR